MAQSFAAYTSMAQPFESSPADASAPIGPKRSKLKISEVLLYILVRDL